MILTYSEILKEIKNGNIVIEPFNINQLNPNSYNLRLHDELLLITDEIIDMKKPTSYVKIKIPPEGYILEPGKLYLGRTYEYTITKNYVPMIEGRSSIARLGISIHSTAGFGDIGYEGFWTLEITVVKPVKIYPLVEICQIFYVKPLGELTFYKGKYQGSRDILVSKIYEELKDEKR